MKYIITFLLLSTSFSKAQDLWDYPSLEKKKLIELNKLNPNLEINPDKIYLNKHGVPIGFIGKEVLLIVKQDLEGIAEDYLKSNNLKFNRYEYRDTQYILDVSGKSIDELIEIVETLRTLYFVKIAEPNYHLFSNFLSNDPLYNSQWNLMSNDGISVDIAHLITNGCPL